MPSTATSNEATLNSPTYRQASNPLGTLPSNDQWKAAGDIQQEAPLSRTGRARSSASPHLCKRLRQAVALIVDILGPKEGNPVSLINCSRPVVYCPIRSLNRCHPGETQIQWWDFKWPSPFESTSNFCLGYSSFSLFSILDSPDSQRGLIFRILLNQLPPHSQIKDETAQARNGIRRIADAVEMGKERFGFIAAAPPPEWP